jgi:glycerol-3-phosphate dehydrogenase
MAEDAVDIAQTLGSLAVRPCATATLAIDAADVQGIAAADGEAPLHPALPLTASAVRWYCREDMARRVEDVLARRSRSLLLDARAAVAVAPAVAQLMAAELGHGEDWIRRQIAEFADLAAGYDMTSLGGAPA